MRMKSILSLSLFISILFLKTAQAYAGELILEVKNITSEGEINIAIYDQADAFEEDGTPDFVSSLIEPVEVGEAAFSFQLPDGVYAIRIYVDANLNKELDTGLFGIPEEQYGFSNNASASFGPPSFGEASFQLSGPTTRHSISLN